MLPRSARAHRLPVTGCNRLAGAPAERAGASGARLLLAHWFSRYLPQFWRRWAMPMVLGVAAAVVVLAV
ncbi:hypothetical protein, partial [Roseiflexus sp.]|uniref:hypothetical protein n=1 Tax=Roseiflexus sp. TaxID=2562120 RepID=UPI00398B3E2C